MKKIILPLIAVLASFLLSGCALFSIRGSGNSVETRYVLDDFTSVSAGYTCDLTVMKGDEFSISVKCDDNIVPYLDTYINGNILNISLQAGYSYSNIEFEATVVMPELKYLTISGASSGSISGFENTGDFTVVVSGASEADINFITSEDINCEVSGASDLDISSINANGDITLSCSGASKADLRNVYANNANVSISGASTGYIDSNGSLNGSISGASTLYYTGNPVLNNISLSGASNISRL